MLIAHKQEHVDASSHPPVYLQEDISEVFQDFLIPRTKFIGLSPFSKLALKEKKQKLNMDNMSMLIVAVSRALVLPVRCQHVSSLLNC